MSTWERKRVYPIYTMVMDKEVLGWVAPAIGCMLANVMFLSPYKVRVLS